LRAEVTAALPKATTSNEAALFRAIAPGFMSFPRRQLRGAEGPCP
jgi:hypothetical protein